MRERTQPRDIPFAGLARETLPRYLARPLRAGGGSRPALLLVEDQGRRAVVKDYAGSGWLLRRLVGPWLIGREARIYRALAGTPGVPRLLGRLDRQALVLEHIPGRSCAEFPDGALPAAFFDRLLEVVRGIHDRGVVHCDIKNRSNIVVGDDGWPYIVDFASAFSREGRLGPVRRFLFERFRLDDLRGVIKARLFVGQLWNEPDARFAFARSPAERLVRALRDGGRWLFRLLAGG